MTTKDRTTEGDFKQVAECLPHNCPQCGRLVANFFDHVDVKCQHWPDPYDLLPVFYRDFEVDNGMYMGFQYAHVDYDGPEDNRCGHEMTLEACYRAIDERLDE